ncbi:hypothetical protein JW998_08515 [candidate division KSB1 bacterium]|nr:hypothetical protein [candidate division KSB1 bacterium]
MKAVIRIFITISISAWLACQNPDTLVDKTDGTLTGNVLPGEAANASGPIFVVASYTNELEEVNWQSQSTVLTRFGTYEIKELAGGKYYIVALLDANRNETLDSGEYWGGHDANGDGRLDYVMLAGGKRLVQDISFIGRY